VAGVDPRSGGLQVALGEWSIGLEAKAIRPGPVTLVVTNRGKFRHGFEIQRAGRHQARDDDDEELETDKLEPGESARLTLDLEPGVYEIECFVSHHDEKGMVGTLTVRADAPLVTAPKAAQANTVEITNFAFKPAMLRVKAGTTVRWRNRDAAQHTATAFDRSFDSKLLGRNAAYARKFSRPGTYSYLCVLHPQMTGKVVVAR
jgi:plastocyanin